MDHCESIVEADGVDKGQPDDLSNTVAKQLSHINANFKDVQALHSHFLQAERMHLQWISKILPDADRDCLISDYAKKSMEHVVRLKRVSLMFTGPKRSGKSTLINALLARDAIGHWPCDRTCL